MYANRYVSTAQAHTHIHTYIHVFTNACIHMDLATYVFDTFIQMT